MLKVKIQCSDVADKSLEYFIEHQVQLRYMTLFCWNCRRGNPVGGIPHKTNNITMMTALSNSFTILIIIIHMIHTIDDMIPIELPIWTCTYDIFDLWTYNHAAICPYILPRYLPHCLMIICTHGSNHVSHCGHTDLETLSLITFNPHGCLWHGYLNLMTMQPFTTQHKAMQLHDTINISP